MPELTSQARQIVESLAQTHGVSVGAVEALLYAVAAGQGTQAQFNHPELGGMGQWSQGGMIMVGDMFNQGLKYKVGALCDELSNLFRSQPFAPAPQQTQSQGWGQSQQQGFGQGVSLFVPGGFGPGWPAELGSPSASGAQNDMSYAFFPATRRLAIRIGGETTIYDTGDHMISGVSQQQSGGASLTFTSQYGLVRLADLPVVGPVGPAPREREQTSVAAPAPVVATPEPAPLAGAAADIFGLIEKLAALRDKNILTEEEFAAKKTELLGRL